MSNSLLVKKARARRFLKLQEARRDPAKFAEYVLKDEATGKGIKNASHHNEWHQHWANNRFAVMVAPVGHGKCAVAGTPHLSSSGSWTNIENQLEEFSAAQVDPRTGEHRAVKASAAMDNGVKPVVRMRFSDGSESGYTTNHKLMTVGGWREAGQLKVGDYVATARKLPDADGSGTQLSIEEARVLGQMVADGGCTQYTPVFTKHDQDRMERFVEEAKSIGLAVTRNGGHSVTLPGAQSFFQHHGLYLKGSHEKRIPKDVFTSKNAIARQFIGAYFDCDGHVNVKSNQIELSTVSRPLAHDMRRLLLRFGVVGTLSSRKTVCQGKRFESYRFMISGESARAFLREVPTSKGLLPEQSKVQGSDVVPKEWVTEYDHRWVDKRVKIGHHRSVVRKAAKEDVSFIASDNVRWVRIEETVGTMEQTYGIEVYDETHAYISDGLVSHNTQCSIARVLYILGKNPNRRVALISDTERQAIKILRQIRSYIESSQELHEVFPHLVPSKRDGDPWTNLELTVNRSALSKDPSIQALGVGGPINGSRVDDMVLDDVVSFESSRTPTQREKIRDWFDTTAITRLTEDATVSVIGTPWHYEDLLHELERRPGFFSRRFSSVLNPDAEPADWQVLWPAKWNKDLLLQRRLNMTAAAFSKKYLCKVVSRETARFKEEWILASIKAGSGHSMISRAPTNPDGSVLRCFTGVDLGIAEKDSSAVSCIFTIALLRSGKRVVCEVQAGHWTAHEIVQRLQSVYERFNSSIFVEDNGAQRFLVQMCDGHVPVSAWTTTAGRKFHEQYGVESLAAEMARGWWVIPSSDGVVVPEVANWLDECRNYDPEQHTGDRLMASWIAREAARSGSVDRTMFLDMQAR